MFFRKNKLQKSNIKNILKIVMMQEISSSRTLSLNDESVRGAGAKVCECNSYFSQRSYSEVLHQPDRSRPVTSNSSCGSWSN